MILAYKPIGKTPLEIVEDFRKKGETLSYAGRLDPMAEGLLLILEGEENKKRREYEHFDKEYIFEVLIGINTDSFDLLGFPSLGKSFTADSSKIELFTKNNLGKISQKYPLYSAFKINGKPLYWWTRNKKKVEIPSRKVEIKSFMLLDKITVGKADLQKEVIKRISLVKGDFRQEEIENAWENLFEKTENDLFEVYKFKLECSSGSYVRSLVNDMGEFLGTKAVTYSIKRTKIGAFELPHNKQESIVL